MTFPRLQHRFMCNLRSSRVVYGKWRRLFLSAIQREGFTAVLMRPWSSFAHAEGQDEHRRNHLLPLVDLTISGRRTNQEVTTGRITFKVHSDPRRSPRTSAKSCLEPRGWILLGKSAPAPWPSDVPFANVCPLKYRHDEGFAVHHWLGAVRHPRPTETTASSQTRRSGIPEYSGGPTQEL
jgi:hypothetical protein